MSEVSERISDGKVLELIRAFLNQDIIEGMKRWTPVGGTPQGAVISPLLANIYLHPLDRHMREKGYRMVRYADDFVVLARDVAEARKAQQAVQEALAGLGLALNQDDTALRSMDMGFSYLGYLFVRSLVLEQPPKEPAALPKLLMPDDVPAASWLAQVPLLRLREVIAEVGTGRRRRQVRVVPLADAPAARLPASRPLYVTSADAQLHLDHGALVIERAGAAPRRFPLHASGPATYRSASTPETAMRYVVAYDIEEDRVRTRIAAVLGGYGTRVQKSVFECNLEQDALDRLTRALSEELSAAPGGDVRIYRLCADCYGASVGLGDLEEGEGREPWILV